MSAVVPSTATDTCNVAERSALLRLVVAAFAIVTLSVAAVPSAAVAVAVAVRVFVDRSTVIVSGLNANALSPVGRVSGSASGAGAARVRVLPESVPVSVVEVRFAPMPAKNDWTAFDTVNVLPVGLGVGLGVGEVGDGVGGWVGWLLLVIAPVADVQATVPYWPGAPSPYCETSVANETTSEPSVPIEVTACTVSPPMATCPVPLERPGRRRRADAQVAAQGGHRQHRRRVGGEGQRTGLRGVEGGRAPGRVHDQRGVAGESAGGCSALQVDPGAAARQGGRGVRRRRGVRELRLRDG